MTTWIAFNGAGDTLGRFGRERDLKEKMPRRLPVGAILKASSASGSHRTYKVTEKGLKTIDSFVKPSRRRKHKKVVRTALS